VDVLTKDVGCIAGFKAEANAILIVNSNAPISFKTVDQFFQLISRALQIAETRRSIQRIQLPGDPLPKLPIEPAGCFRGDTVVNIRGIGIFE